MNDSTTSPPNVAAFGWLPSGVSQNDLDDGDFAWTSDKYRAGKESKSEGRKLPFKIKGKVNEAGWKAAWSRAHQDATDFSGGPSQSAVIAKLKAAQPSGVEVSMSTTVDFSDTLATPAEFSNVTIDAPDMVTRTGKLFACGEYADKDFTFDESDLTNAIEGFTSPISVDLEHIPTVLADKLGHVSRIFASEDGKSLMGEVQLPKWLDSVLEDGGRRVSATWDRASKQLRGLALVRDPRVTDAALFASFNAANTEEFAGTRHDTPSGQKSMQTMHDAAVQEGAICRRVAMASRHESSAIQQMHDTAVAHGASCEPPAGATPKTPDPDAISTYSATTPITIARSKRNMNVLDWITGKAKEEGVELDPAELQAAFSTDPSPDMLAMKETLAKREAEIIALHAAQEIHTAQFARAADERRQAEAVAFAERQVSARRLTPAAAEKLAPLYARVAAADATVTFAEGDKTTIAMLQEFTDSLLDLSMFTTSQVKSDEVAALFNRKETDGDGTYKAPTQERLDELHKATPLGRAILKDRIASNGK